MTESRNKIVVLFDIFVKNKKKCMYIHKYVVYNLNNCIKFKVFFPQFPRSCCLGLMDNYTCNKDNLVKLLLVLLKFVFTNSEIKAPNK